MARLQDNLCASGTDEFAARLARLRLEHNAFRQRNPSRDTGTTKASDISTVVESGTSKPQSFSDWFRSENRPAWQFAPWWCIADMPSDVEAEHRETTGKSAATWISDKLEDKCVIHMATLECQFFKNRYAIGKNGMRWWYPDAVRPTEEHAWSEAPHIFLAQTLVPDGCTVPFELNDQFKHALSDGVCELGEACEQMIGAVTDDFVNTIAATISHKLRQPIALLNLVQHFSSGTHSASDQTGCPDTANRLRYQMVSAFDRNHLSL